MLTNIFGLVSIIIIITAICQSEEEILSNGIQICLKDNHCQDGSTCQKLINTILG